MKVLFQRFRAWRGRRRQLRLERAQRRAMLRVGHQGRPEDIYGQSVRQMGQPMGDG